METSARTSLECLFAHESGARVARKVLLTMTRNSIVRALRESEGTEVSVDLPLAKLLEHKLELASMGIYSLIDLSTGRRKILHKFGPACAAVLQERLVQRGLSIGMVRVRRSPFGSHVLKERRVRRFSEPP